MSQQAVVVAAGSVAGEAGSFCVAKQDVLLIQRTFGLNTARDFEAALGSKSNQATTTTTTVGYSDFDFAGNVSKEVTVMAGECPPAQSGLVQTVEESVSDKQQEPVKPTLNADQLRVCGCRNFLKRTVVNAQTTLSVDQLESMLGDLAATAAAAVAAEPKAAVLLQRNFDTVLASKNAPISTTSTTTSTTIDRSLTTEFAPLVEACTLASAFPGSWTMVAKEVNNPDYVPLFNSFNITGGWEHCDKSWVVQGACTGFVTVATTAAPTEPVAAAPTEPATVATTSATAATDAP